MSKFHLIWEEIDLSCIAHNVRELRRSIAGGTAFMAVVKANGYGHGSVRVAKTSLENGASMLGVARVEEALHLRAENITAPILIFGYAPRSDVKILAEHDLIPTIYSRQMAEGFSEEASRLGVVLPVHIKVDTGMGRVGFLPDGLNAGSQSLARDFSVISSLGGIKPVGIYTHFAQADGVSLEQARGQLALFQEALEIAEMSGMCGLMKHASNSAGILRLPEANLDMVRAGISMYGLYPSREVDRSSADLRPALSIKSRVVHLKRVPAGFTVSYGSTHVTEKETIVASVPVGYADGYSRLASSEGSMLVRGQRAPVIGRVCMDQLLLDVGHIPDVQVEDEVVVLGRQGDEEITAEELADVCQTINYEVVSTIMPRVPKIYL